MNPWLRPKDAARCLWHALRGRSETAHRFALRAVHGEPPRDRAGRERGYGYSPAGRASCRLCPSSVGARPACPECGGYGDVPAA